MLLQNVTEFDPGTLPIHSPPHSPPTGQIDQTVVIAVSAVAAVLCMILLATIASCTLRKRASRQGQPFGFVESRMAGGSPKETPAEVEPLRLFANNRFVNMNNYLVLQSDPPTEPEPFKLVSGARDAQRDASLAIQSDPPTDPDPFQIDPVASSRLLNRSLNESHLRSLRDYSTDLRLEAGVPLPSPPLLEEPHEGGFRDVGDMHAVHMPAVEEEPGTGMSFSICCGHR